MACPHKYNCPLYEQFRVKALLNFWIASYCDSGHERCARFKLSSEGKPVPLALLPSGDILGSLNKSP